MADRFTRQTLKNGSATLAVQMADTENNHLSSIMNKKAAITTTTTSAATTMFNKLAVFSTNTTNTLANINRNALGDIGNKIITSNINQLLINKGGKMPVDSTTSQQKQETKIELDDVLVVSDDDDELSAMEVTNDIIDIDEFDAENTQLVSEYVKDIYSYLIQLERRFRISPTFLEQKIVTAKMRSVLIDWLIQVHLKFHLLQETLYLCVQIIDAFLQVQDIPKMQLQLVGVTAMFVASKYEEMYVPAIEDFVYMTDNTYTKSEIRQMEINILKTLDFMFGKPLPLHFLRRFSKAGQADPKQHTLAKYFMELSLHDVEFSSLDPSYLAASSLCLSFQLLKGSDWNRTMEYYSTYKQESLNLGMHKIAKLVLKSSELDYRYRAATTKYATSKFMRISILPELSGDLIKKIALNTNF
jgi:G2/mitotic-specific cyclin-B2